MITIKEIFEDIEKNGGFTPSRRVRDIATMYPDKVAFRDKRFGIWNESTYDCLLYTSPSPRDDL